MVVVEGSPARRIKASSAAGCSTATSATGVVPCFAIKITEAEYQKMAAEIIKQLQIAGVSIQDRDIRQIVEEVQKHPETIRKAFDLMQQGFEGEQSSAATGL